MASAAPPPSSSARRGAAVAINHPTAGGVGDAQETERLAEATRQPGDDAPSLVVRADVSREGDVLAMFETVREHLGTVDVLVNNAGIQIVEPSSHETTAEHFDNVLGGQPARGVPCAPAERCAVFWTANRRAGRVA